MWARGERPSGLDAKPPKVAAGIIAVRLQPQTRADPAPQVRND